MGWDNEYIKRQGLILIRLLLIYLTINIQKNETCFGIGYRITADIFL